MRSEYRERNVLLSFVASKTKVAPLQSLSIPQFKPFTANRIGEIQTSTNPNTWRYVPTKENPADYLTRGTTLTELSQLKVWWEGPIFLSEDKSNWPQLETIDKPNNHTGELKRKYSNIQLSPAATLVNVEISMEGTMETKS